MSHGFDAVTTLNGNHLGCKFNTFPLLDGWLNHFTKKGSQLLKMEVDSFTIDLGIKMCKFG